MTMNDQLKTPPLISDRSGVTDAVRVQILATEHWSLLATRSMTWNEVFSRASMFITVLSAAVVALALVAQATSFGSAFRIFALLTLPIVLLVGLATVIRLGDANTEDFRLMIGMNRLRHAYLDLAPELEQYMVTSSHDDEASIMQSYGVYHTLRISRVLAGTPTLVGAINVIVAGVFVALVAKTFGASDMIATAAGVVAALAAIAGLAWLAYSTIASGRRANVPRFPR
jgi:uncharacterized membrane protein YuzA (DUF378 family)